MACMAQSYGSDNCYTYILSPSTMQATSKTGVCSVASGIMEKCIRARGENVLQIMRTDKLSPTPHYSSRWQTKLFTRKALWYIGEQTTANSTEQQNTQQSRAVK